MKKETENSTFDVLTFDVESLKYYINEVQGEIRTLKTRECTKRSDYCLQCKRAFEAVKNLKLFDKKHNRLYTESSPFVVKDPETDILLKVWSINSKRRVKAILSYRWFEARERLSKTIEQLADAKKELQGYRRNLKQLVARLNAIENDRG